METTDANAVLRCTQLQIESATDKITRILDALCRQRNMKFWSCREQASFKGIQISSITSEDDELRSAQPAVDPAKIKVICRRVE
jgi:hypothetical protein